MNYIRFFTAAFLCTLLGLTPAHAVYGSDEFQEYVQVASQFGRWQYQISRLELVDALLKSDEPIEAIVDADGDGVPNQHDLFPFDPFESMDTDADMIGNNADNDDDNDGFADYIDAFPIDAAMWMNPSVIASAIDKEVPIAIFILLGEE